MDSSEQQIIVTAKLFGGLHGPAGVDCMEAMRGVEVELHKGATVAHLIKYFGLKRSAKLLFFVDGKSVGISSSLRDRSVISICSMVAGG